MQDPRAIDLGKKGLGDEKIMPVIHVSFAGEKYTLYHHD